MASGITTDIFLILTGLVLLYYGGEFLVTGCVRIAQHFKISPFIIGATIIGFGTSSPELAVSILAALEGAPELAMGNVIGSNVTNVGLVLGLTALLIPLSIPKRRLKEEAPALIGATLLILLLAWDKTLGRFEGLVMVILVVLYVWRSLKKEEEAPHEIEEEEHIFAGRGMGYQALLTIGGLVLLILGADWLVDGATHVARSLGISEWLIGISIVALGTSLPEIVSSLIAARKGHGEMAIGNVFGSNIFNILMVLGLASAVHPLHIQENIQPDLIYTTLFTLGLIVLIRLEHHLSKKNGLILLAGYVAYMGLKVSGTL